MSDEADGEKLADVLTQIKRKKRIDPRVVTVAATGIGSAALVAALLYANKSRRKKPDSE
jgi:hypothetical protein